MITSVIIYHYGSALSLEIFRHLTLFFRNLHHLRCTNMQRWCDEWRRPPAPSFFQFPQQFVSLVSDSTSTASATGGGCWVVGIR